METEHSGRYKGENIRLIYLILWVSVLVLSACNYNAPPLPAAHEGILDAQNLWQQQPGIYSLKGEWDFFPQEFILPGDIATRNDGHKIWLPGVWTGKQYAHFHFPITHGTYRLRIVNHGLPEDFYIRSNDINCAFKIWINGTLVLEGGKVSAVAGNEIPFTGPVIGSVKGFSDTLEVVLQVSNHRNRVGGVFQSIQLGPEVSVLQDYAFRIGIDSFLGGALLIMAVYYLMLFIVFRNDRASLYFSLFIFVITLRTLVIGQRTILLAFPSLSWEFLIRAEFFTFYAAPIVFVLYFNSVFPRSSKKWIRSVTIAVSSLFSLLVLFFPPAVFIQTLTYYQIFVIAFGLFILHRAIIAFRMKEKGAGIFLIGAAMIFLAMTHDILQVISNITGKEIFPVGLLIFVFSQSYVLSLKFSGINKRNEDLYRQLEYSKKNLEVVVESRTRELIQQKNLLMETNEELEQQKRTILSQTEAVEEINEMLEKEKEKTDQLLLNVLPKHIADELKLYGKSLAHSYPLVSVLFVDFVGFSDFSERMDPGILLKDLHFYFANFDDVARKYNMEKIKTIGDAYMCAGGLRESADERDVISTVSAGLEIAQFIRSYQEDRISVGEHAMECRIGIHTGPVIAGVVGKSKFSFDIWGPTVNIAKRMETACEPGRVNISEDTWNYVKDHFYYTSRGIISMKHKKNMQMFYIDRFKMQS